MFRSLDEVLREIKEHYGRLNSKLERLGDENALANLPPETGVSVIYDWKNKPPLYVGETDDLSYRLKSQLFRCEHTLSWRLVKGQVGKSLGFDGTSLEALEGESKASLQMERQRGSEKLDGCNRLFEEVLIQISTYQKTRRSKTP